MFAFLEGNIAYKSPSLLYLDLGGVGYEVNITLHTYDKIKHVDKCRLYTHLQVREDAWVMFGFADEDERATFRQLLNVNGVGAATARIILSSLTADDLALIIATDNQKALEKVKGIGAKTAQRILLELKGKVIKQNTGSSAAKHNTIAEDALIALVNLGIARAVAESAVKKVPDSHLLTLEDLIKQALRVL